MNDTEIVKFVAYIFKIVTVQIIILHNSPENSVENYQITFLHSSASVLSFTHRRHLCSNHQQVWEKILALFLALFVIAIFTFFRSSSQICQLSQILKIPMALIEATSGVLQRLLPLTNLTHSSSLEIKMEKFKCVILMNRFKTLFIFS